MSLKIEDFQLQIDRNPELAPFFYVLIEWEKDKDEIKKIERTDFPRYEIINKLTNSYYPRVKVLDTVTVFPNKIYDLSTKEGQNVLYQYLREGFKFGKKEFRIVFQEGVHFIIHPLGKDGETRDFILTKNNTI
jgi:hypothetical protein